MHSLAIAGLLPVCVAVFGVAGSTQVVTEADVLSQLDGGNPAVIESSRHLPLAQAELVAARAFDNPVLELTREEPDESVSQTEWLLSWQLPGSARRLEIAAAEKSVDAAAARVDHQLSSLRLALREDYADWAVASARRRILESETDRLTALASREKARAQKGESSGLQAHRLSLAEMALSARLSLTVAEETQTHAELERWLPQLAPDARPELPPLPQPSVRDSQEATDRVHEHPALTATQAELEAAALKRKATEHYFPSPELTLGWQQKKDFSDEQSGPMLGLLWTLPLFDRKQAARDKALAHLEAAQARAEMIAREIAARSTAADSRYIDLVQSVVESKAALEPSTDMLAGAETSFRYGELSLTDLLEIQRSVTEAHLAWLELYSAALAAHRDLEALTGPLSTAPAIQPATQE